jgi:G3E family GTPase
MSLPPFTVIGGYLGAGKTTLLNHLLTEAHGLRAAVLVNDFGEVNIDAALIAAHDGDTISLANGCMCCSLTGGFAQAINNVLAHKDRLDAIVVEASGVAEPGKIAHYGQMYDLPLDGVIVVVDAERIRAQAVNKYVGDVVLLQLAQADLILLNKTDCVSANALADVRDWLGETVPGVPVYETLRSNAPVDLLLGHGHTPRPAHPLHLAGQRLNHERLHSSWIIRRDRPVTRAAIERLAERMGGRIFRAKGFVQLSEDPARRYLLQLVGRRWTLEELGHWGSLRPRTEIVCIGPPARAVEPARPSRRY